MRDAFLLAALALSASAHAAPVDPATERDVVTFRASVRVDVDASGKPVKVETPQDLPQAIRALIEKRVASWQYQPANLGGVPQAATTYVSINACAVPVGEGYRLGVDFNSNGPRVAAGKAMTPPDYPEAAMRAGTDADFSLTLKMDGAGRAAIDTINRLDISGRAGAGGFEPELRRWVKTLRFDPEIVAGRPVPTKIRMQVGFDTTNARRSRKSRDDLQAKARESRECRMVSGTYGLRPVALQPAVTIIPRPPG